MVGRAACLMTGCLGRQTRLRPRLMGIPFQFETVHALAVLPGATTRKPTAAANDCGTPLAEHACGDCQACCTYLPIAAGEVCTNAKPAGVDCPHLGHQGCGIYPRRPEICRRFRCVWHMEPSWPQAWRPDRSGLLCLCEEIDDGLSAALVYEIERDAIARPTTESILAKLKESTAVVALVNLQRQRQLLRGRQWVEPAEPVVRRPHFLRPIRATETDAPETMRDAS